MLEEVKIEVYILGSGNHSECAAVYEGKEIKVDLITADVAGTEEDVHGKVSLEGFWDEDVFVAESLKTLN